MTLGAIIFIAICVSVCSSQRNDKYQCNPNLADISESCLGCICTTSSDCKVNQGCISGGELCGAFLISRPFWVDAGRCTLNGENPSNPGAFENCANNLACAADIIRSYVGRFQKDCNGDQLVTCEDFIMLHKNGGWNCGKNLQGSRYWNKYLQCKDRVIANGNNI